MKNQSRKKGRVCSHHVIAQFALDEVRRIPPDIELIYSNKRNIFPEDVHCIREDTQKELQITQETKGRLSYFVLGIDIYEYMRRFPRFAYKICEPPFKGRMGAEFLAHEVGQGQI